MLVDDVKLQLLQRRRMLLTPRAAEPRCVKLVLLLVMKERFICRKDGRAFDAVKLGRDREIVSGIVVEEPAFRLEIGQANGTHEGFRDSMSFS